MGKRSQKLTEEEKKAKFGDKYDPDWLKKHPRKPGEPGKREEKRDVPERNDYTFYVYDEQVSKDAASFSYPYLQGLNHAINVKTVTYDTTGNGTVSTVTKRSVDLQQAMGIAYIPYYGYNSQVNDGINIAAMELFTFIRHKARGARTYQASDCEMYVLAASDVYSNLMEAKRILGIAQSYSPENRGFPTLLAQAAGENYLPAVQKTLADKRMRWNVLASKANSIAVPKNFKVFLRRAYVSSNVFADSDSGRGQFYVFRKKGYHVWEAQESSQGTMLKYEEFVHSGADSHLEELLNAVETQLTAILTDDDAQTISGDILNAFGDAEMHEIVMTDEKYVTPVVFDEDILNQIENAVAWKTHTFGSAVSIPSGAFDVTQHTETASGRNYITSGLVLNLKVTNVNFQVMERVVFNSHSTKPDRKTNIEWSRLTSVGVLFNGNVTGTLNNQLAIHAGIELIDGFWYYHMSGSLTPTASLLDSNQLSANTSAAGQAQTAVALSQFDWHPILYINQGGTNSPQLGICGDLKYYTFVEAETMASLHARCNEALFWDASLYKRAKSPSA